jgi:hypothetical protein
MMGETQRRALKEMGKDAMDPYTSERFRNHYKSELKRARGLSFGQFASSNYPETNVHEGIHAAFQHASAKAGISADYLYRIIGAKINQQFPNVTDALQDYILQTIFLRN